MSLPLGAFDPFCQAFRKDPYPVYDRYRASDPVHWGPPGTPGIDGTWYLTRYADVSTLLRDPRFAREYRHHSDGKTPAAIPEALRPLVEITRRQMLFRDPPEHTRLRALVAGAFTPAAAERLRPQVEQIANALLDRVAERGAMDVIADYAVPLTVGVIADVIGVPADQHCLMRKWSASFASAIDVRQSFDAAARASGAIAEMSAFIRQLMAARRSSPTGDLLSRLLLAEADSDRLTDDEIVAMCCLLLIGGNETLVNLIGNGMLTLLRHPGQLCNLTACPNLLPSAVEELLRFESPVQMTFRYALKESEIAGRRIQQGASVCFVLAAANRDPERFSHPHVLDLMRENNRHLAFGAGIHVCLGAALARLEGQIAFEVLLRRLDAIRLAGEVEWRDLIAFRGLRGLSIAFSPR